MHKETCGYHAHAQQSDALMHTHTRPSAEAFGVAANGINNAGRQGASFAAWAVPAQQTTNETKRDEQRNATLCSLPVPGNSVPPKGLFARTSEQSRLFTELSAKDELATKLRYWYGRATAATLKAITTYLPTSSAQVAASGSSAQVPEGK